MKFSEFNEAIDPSDKAAIKGMHQLSTDQYVGLYKTMKDVAGHDGKKQTAPNGYSDNEISDKPFAYAYTDEEEAMIKGADPKAKKITSSKSEEVKESFAGQLHQDTLDLIDEYIAKVEPRADRNELIKSVHDGYIDTSELEYALQGVAEGNYDDNRTGFSRGPRDDERHDLDVPRPTIFALKINGKIWQKDGNVVTFFTRERALAARNSILNKRPELEVGLVQRQD